ncbi:MAG: hypothetical protein KC444_07745 [Nitrosopumilus sp.]|nr:hypothetical protein [Nitrosopumilus sp.]
MSLDDEKLMDFMHKAIHDLGATVSASLVVIGEKLGLYKAMAGFGPITVKNFQKRQEWQNDMFLNGLTIKLQAGMWFMILKPKPIFFQTNTLHASLMKTALPICQEISNLSHPWSKMNTK